MLVGYMRVSTEGDRQVLDLQRDALLSAGVDERHLFEDRASGSRGDRAGLAKAIAFIRSGDCLVVWKLDRLGRSLPPPPHHGNRPHRQEERHFEVIAGKVIDAQGIQSRFAFARNGPTIASEAFKQALAAAGVQADTPATVLCDGDAGLWRMQHEVLPKATVVLDWWHAAVHFEHALQAARGLGACAADKRLADEAVRGLERAKWRLWPGRWPGCRRKLATLCRWARRKHVRGMAGIERFLRHVHDLLGYLARNESALVHYAARSRCGEPISTAFVESAVNEIVAKRMNKKQQMRWNRATVQPFLGVRTAVLDDTLEDAFRHRYPGFRPANNNDEATAAAA